MPYSLATHGPVKHGESRPAAASHSAPTRRPATSAANCRELRWLLPLLLISAELPLAYAEGSPWRLSILALAIVVGWWWVDRRGRAGLPPWLATALVLLATVFLLYEWRHSHPVLALSHYIVAMCALKLVQRRGVRDYAQLVVLAMLLLVIGGVVNETLIYAACLAVYLSAGLYAVIVLHFHREAERVAQRRQHAGLPAAAAGAVPPRVRGITAAAALGTCLVGAVIFLVFPRLSGGIFDSPMPGLGAAITGYTPDLRLYTSGDIAESDAAVMRVVLSQDGAPLQDPNFVGYYRGNTLDTYKHERERARYTWSSSAQLVGGKALELSPLQPLDLGNLLQPSHTLEQHYWIDQARVQYLFTLYPARSIQSERIGRTLEHSDDRSLRLPASKSGMIDYVVVSAAAESAWAVEEFDPLTRPIVPSAPAIQPDSPVHAVVKQIQARVRDPEDAAALAEAIQKYLTSPPFSYTLKNAEPDRRREPVEDLLFHRRRGHCELFASAMTVICQLAGLRARVTQGYRGGEFNAIGGYYQVRQRDAHAWVEVWIPGRGWMTYDPSPASHRTGAVSSDWSAVMRQYVDNLQFQWLNLVVSYSTQNQGQLKGQVDAWIAAANDPSRSRLGRWWSIAKSFATGEGLPARDRVRYWATLLAVLGLSVLWIRLVARLLSRLSLIRRRARRRRQSGGANDVEFYDRLLRLLARQGFTKAPHQTPHEFAATVVKRRPDWAVIADLTRLYYAARYDVTPLAVHQLGFIREMLGKLKC